MTSHPDGTTRPRRTACLAMSEHPQDRLGQPIVVGVGGRCTTWDAVEWAAAEAAGTGAGLHLVHVIEWPVTADMWPEAMPTRVDVLEAAGASQLAAAVERAREVAPGIHVETRLETGGVATALTGAAEWAAMLVLGKGRRPARWWRSRRTSTAVAVARRSACPVAVVELCAEPGGEFSGLVVVVDPTHAGESAALAFARSSARLRGVGVMSLETRDQVQSAPSGAALVVVGGRRPPRPGRRLPAGVGRALVHATSPTVLVLCDHR